MSTSRFKLAGDRATLDDCARLWHTLTNDYIPGLRVEILVGVDQENQPYVQADLVDYSDVAGLPNGGRSVWATKRFFSPLYLISHTQLFDLLIKGYRVIDEFFSTGRDMRPSTLKG